MEAVRSSAGPVKARYRNNTFLKGIVLVTRGSLIFYRSSAPSLAAELLKFVYLARLQELVDVFGRAIADALELLCAFRDLPRPCAWAAVGNSGQQRE
jgi:ABC-type thiamine transport system substrate-binding protein